ncbi:long-chain-fatty-acid--CoA ligase [Alkalihalobacterium alkalinitrilicum]|uniref:long-chain-fatty-acid--CoA ligase n=1 Tax=Alkalihalobacterium alkalinitrilicum TaxID=427920 RepID=UPI00099535C4|nr:long-chain fatty acid--CoA ligase [Alkalihalobacterium alkalinitrilicum]
MNVVELLVASSARLPNHVAFVTNDEKITYSQLQENVWDAASKLSSVGIKENMNVALMVSNRIVYIYSYFALLALGSTVVPINPLFKERELLYILNDAEVEAIIFDGVSSETVLAARKNGSSLKTEICIDDSNKDGLINWKSIEANDLKVDHSKSCAVSHVAQIIYTSGTTGNPKGAMISHYNLVWMAITCGGINTITSEDRVLCTLPLFHAYAIVQSILSPIAQGATIYLKERFQVEQVLQTIDNENITVFFGVPTMYSMIIHSPEVKNYSYNSLRNCASGGASLPVEHIEKLIQIFGIEIIEGYGQTESTVGISYNPLNGIKKVGSVGLPIPGISIKVLDTNDNEVSKEEVGEIIFTGPNVMQGYYNKQEETAKTIKNGWVYTGDLGYIDQDGYLYIKDRKKEMIIKGGYNVYPREIEEVLYQHPDMVECAVVGIPDEKFGEVVHAYVVTRNITDEEELKKYCKEQLVHYKVPEKFIFVEELPKNASGKILKRSLIG